MHTKALTLLCVAFALHSLAHANELRSRAWAYAQQHAWDEARPLFEQLISLPDEAIRKDRFGLALCFLYRQPRTRTTLDAADKAFAQLVSEAPDDSVGVASQYYRIRGRHVFSLELDLNSLKQAYKALHNEHPGTFYGQQSYVRLVLLTAFSHQPVEELRAALPTLEHGIYSLTHAASRRDAALALAQAYLVIVRDKPAALRWFKVADEAGLTNRADNRRPYLSAAGTAWDLGDWESARHFYQRYLDLKSLDRREEIVRQRLAAIEKLEAGIPVDLDAVP